MVTYFSMPGCIILMDRGVWWATVHGDSPGSSTGVGCHALLQGIFPTQGSNLGLLHCRQILLRLSHQKSPVLCHESIRIDPII